MQSPTYSYYRVIHTNYYATIRVSRHIEARGSPRVFSGAQWAEKILDTQRPQQPHLYSQMAKGNPTDCNPTFSKQECLNTFSTSYVRNLSLVEKRKHKYKLGTLLTPTLQWQEPSRYPHQRCRSW